MANHAALAKARLITLALRAAADARLSARAHAVLAHVVADAWPLGSRWRATTAVAVLARRLACSERAVQQALSELTTARILVRLRGATLVVSVVADESDRGAAGCAVADVKGEAGCAVADHRVARCTQGAQPAAQGAQPVAPYPVQTNTLREACAQLSGSSTESSRTREWAAKHLARRHGEASPPQLQLHLEQAAEARQDAPQTLSSSESEPQPLHVAPPGPRELLAAVGRALAGDADRRTTALAGDAAPDADRPRPPAELSARLTPAGAIA